MLKRVFILSLFLVALITGCQKPASTAVVPPSVVNVGPVDIRVWPYTPLTNIGGWTYISGGYSGLLLFRNTASSILVFDRGCPYDCQANWKAIDTFQTKGTTARCPICGSTYSLFGGGVVTVGPGTVGLKQYYTTYNDPYLTISSTPLQ